MANRTVSFRLPEELINTIEERAKFSGKTKTDLIIEALAQVFDVPEPMSASVTITSIQQQVDALKQKIGTLEQSNLDNQAELQEQTVKLITVLRQTLQPLQEGNQILAPKSDGPLSITQEAITPDIYSDSCSEIQSLALVQDESVQNLSQVALLDITAAHEPGLLAAQVQYQMEVFDKVFSAIPELVFICDRIGHFTYVSPFGTSVWGIERTELLGRLYHDATLPSEFLDFNLSQFEMALSFGKLSSAEIRVMSAHSIRHYEYTLSPIQDDHGVVIGIVGIALDITQRKQAELALQESLERYRNLFELANDMIFIVDAESHKIVDANFKASRRLRYTRKELCQMTLEDIETTESATYFQSAIIPQLEKAGSAIFTHALRRKNGDVIPVEISVRLIEFGDRLAYQSFARDMSGRKLT